MRQESAADGICEISEINSYLIGIKPLLEPQLALPAEEEDKLDHGDEAELPLLDKTAAAQPSLSPCRLLMQAHSLPLPVTTWL